MSVELKVGMEIPVADALKGHSSRGPYFKATVKPEKGKDRIDIWATNPGEAINFSGMAKIVEITGVKKSAHQYNGKWYDDFSVDAKLAQGNAEAVIFEQVELGNDEAVIFEQVELGNDDDLPFA